MMVCPGINGMTWPSIVIEFDELDIFESVFIFELIYLLSFLFLSYKVSCSIIPMRDLARLFKCRIQIEMRLKVAMHQTLFKH